MAAGFGGSVETGWRFIGKVPGTWWKVILFIVILLSLRVWLPIIAGIFLADFNVVNAEWTRIAIPAATAAAGVGVLCLISPWHGSHAAALLMGAAEAIFLTSLLPIATPFLSTHLPGWMSGLAGILGAI